MSELSPAIATWLCKEKDAGVHHTGMSLLGIIVEVSFQPGNITLILIST